MIDLNDLYAVKNDMGFLAFSYGELDKAVSDRGCVLFPRSSEWRGEEEVAIFRLKNTFSNVNDPRNMVRIPKPEAKAILQACVYDAVGGTSQIGDYVRTETAWNTTAGRNNREVRFA